METNLPPRSESSPAVRIFGVGDTGISAINLLIEAGLSPELCVAANTGGSLLQNSPAATRLVLETKRLRGLGSGGDPDRGRQAAEAQVDELKALCADLDVVFIVAGLGGGAGTGISPVLARVAKAAGALVLAFVTTPFECEGSRRQSIAEEGLEELRDHADGVVCLPNQKIFKLIEENTTVIETFRIANRLLADGVAGVWRLLSFKGLIEIPMDELCGLLQDRHSECLFAVAESIGAEPVRQVIERLLNHPLLDDGEALLQADTVLVSLTGGPGLTMTQVNSVIQQLKTRCGSSQMLVGACCDERFGDRLAVTLITVRKTEAAPAPRAGTEELSKQLLDRTPTAKPGSRFVPPPPALAPDQVQQLLARQSKSRSAGRKTSSKMRQGQLPLDIVSKGRFDKSEPTIHKGEDLDVPTYIRRGVPLN